MKEYEEIAKKIKEADALLIGASNGLSITEGLNLFANDETFANVFGDYKEKYGFRCILDGLFFKWKTVENKWGFLSRLINYYSGSYETSQVMEDLKMIISDKPYFVLTSNLEGHFELSGLDASKVYELEGNWIEMRCSHLCHEKTYPTLSSIKSMVSHEKQGVVPNEMIPRCPKCNALMELYNSQPPKQSIVSAWESFYKKYHDKKLVILELGIGWRNQLIKAPLMKITADEPYVTYITINLGEVYIPNNIKNKSYGLDGYLSTHLSGIREALKR